MSAHSVEIQAKFSQIPFSATCRHTTMRLLPLKEFFASPIFYQIIILKCEINCVQSL